MEGHRAIIFAVLIALVSVSSLLALVSVSYALIFAAAVLAIVIFFFKPFYGLLLYLALLYIRPQEFIPELGRMRIVLIFAIILILVYFVHKIARREEIHVFLTRQHVLMFMLLLLAPISQIANFRVAKSWDAAQDFLTNFLLFFILVNIPNDFKEFRTVCWLLFACTTFIAANGIIQHFRGVDLIGQRLMAGRTQWIGLFGDPNQVALLIDSFLPFVLVNVFDKEMRLLKRTCLVAIGIVMVAAIYFTNSRGGFVAFLAILLLFSYKRWGLLRGSAIGAILIIVGLLNAPSRMADMSPYEVSAAGRINLWTTGLSLLKSHPVFGIGYNSFQAYNNGVAAHSATVQCFAELGLLGYAVWLTLLYSSLSGLATFEKRCPSSPYRKYASILQLSFAGFIGTALFLSVAYFFIFYLLVALATLIIKSEGESVIQRRMLSTGETLRIAILIVGTIVGYKLVGMVPH
jgi:putative inorganic carbon (HCO3(-)) transporter